jgi:predicted NBD/HSP70 family sugar kinase
VNHLEGLVVDSPNIGWHDVPVRKALREDLRLPVHVEAMHHTLNLAEARVQRGRAIDDAVLVNIAMGIGASVMQEGRIVRGRHAAAGQIGHMHVAGATELCTCGRRGCLDTVASGYAVLRRLGRVPARRIPREHRPADAGLLIKAIAQAARGESDVKRAFGACGEQLGEALNAVRAVVDPEHIWLAGPLAQAESFVEGVLSRFDVAARGDNDKVMPKLALSSLSSDAAAALLALKLFAFGPALDLARARA